MTRYRKRPHDVDALQVDGTEECANRITACHGGTPFPCGHGRWAVRLHGSADTAWPGDWVLVRDGVVYTMTNDLFVNNYDAL